MNDYVSKPIDKGTLRQVIDRSVGRTDKTSAEDAALSPAHAPAQPATVPAEATADFQDLLSRWKNMGTKA
jgi:hypothetical protein